MSLKYRNNQGVETPVAGLNGQNGSLVPSVALQQSGRTGDITCSGFNYASVQITFVTPMPDANYEIIYNADNLVSFACCSARNKTAQGFMLYVYNPNETELTGNISWTAFKLMTDTVHEADAAHIAQNTANFAPAFSEVTSYAVGDYCTYNNVLYRCTTAHTAGTWVAGHFTQVTVGGDLSAIDILKTDFANFGKIDTASGYLTDDQLKAINYNVCKTVGYAGSAEIPDSTTILVGFMNFTQGTDQQYQLLFQFNMGKVWTRSRYGTWTSWQKLATESNLAIKKIDISAPSGATSFSATIPLSMAQRNKPFYLEVLSVADNNAIKEMKYLVFVSSINTNVSIQEVSKDPIFTNLSITFNESTGYELSFSSTGILYSTTVYIQQ